MELSFIIGIVASLAVGFLVGYVVRRAMGIRSVSSAEAKAEHIIQEARSKEKEILLQAKDRALGVIDDAKRDEEARRRELSHAQQRLEKRESLFDQKLLDLENKQTQLAQKAEEAERAKQKIVEIREQQLAKLEKIAGLTQEQAKNVLMENMKLRAHDELSARLRKLDEVGSEQWDEKARHLLSMAMERCASSHAVETTTTSLVLPSDEMKGRIIGKEGRNIKTLEQLTGVEIIIDETPETLLISGFSPIRRHLAKKALDRLMVDGRIHPGRIEEAVEQARKDLALNIKKAGESAVREAGLLGVDPRLAQILGRLKYRTSYGQNQLVHALEVTHLAGMLAEELGADVTITKRGALFHDIGKAVDHEVQGGHPEIGYDILKKFGMPEEVAYIAKSHHEDMPETLECVIVKVADAISGARVGARKDTLENYLQRLTELEEVANSFAGVDKSYAIQAGREVRVFVKPEEIDDWAATKMAKDIATKVEADLKYPGEIKITVIREKRTIEYAK